VQAQLRRIQIQQTASPGIEVVQDPAGGQAPVSPTSVRTALLALEVRRRAGGPLYRNRDGASTPARHGTVARLTVDVRPPEAAPATL
jgi:hypothetical protein